MTAPRRHGLTLIELVITLGLTTLVVTTVTAALTTLLTTFDVVQSEVWLQKTVDETLQELVDGSYEAYGIKDCLELLTASRQQLACVPPWVDAEHEVTTDPTRGEPQPFVLRRPLRAGASTPRAEARLRTPSGWVWRAIDIAFQAGTATLAAPLPEGTRVRFIYHPDVQAAPDVQLAWAFEQAQLQRTYQGRTQRLLRRPVKTLRLTALTLQYFDNTNTEIRPDARGRLTAAEVAQITALQATLTAAFGTHAKTGTVFMGLRNAKTAGSGFLLRPGTQLPIPDSRSVKTFSLTNVTGVPEGGGRLVLEARNDEGRSWRLVVELKRHQQRDYLGRYTIEYPAGQTVYGETLNQTTDLPLNCLTLGGNGRYDYDLDADGKNVVDLSGAVLLTVKELDAAGATLFIRP